MTMPELEPDPTPTGVISIDYTAVLNRCVMLSSYEGREAYDTTGKSRYANIHINTNDEPLVLGYIYQSEAELRNRLDDMISAVDESTNGYTWTLKAEDKRLKDKGRWPVDQWVQEAMTAYAMRMWLSDAARKPERTQFYEELYRNMVKAIEDFVFKKQEPEFQ